MVTAYDPVAAQDEDGTDDIGGWRQGYGAGHAGLPVGLGEDTVEHLHYELLLGLGQLV